MATQTKRVTFSQRVSTFFNETGRSFSQLTSRKAKSNSPASVDFAMVLAADARFANQRMSSLSENQNANSDIYTHSSWVYVGVNKISNAAALVDLQLYKRSEDDEDTVYLTAGNKDRIIAHPMLSLLRHPNPVMSKYNLLFNTFASLTLNGNCYWWLDRPDDSTAPTAIWLPRPEKITINMGKTSSDPIESYTYTANGQEIIIPAYQIIHLKHFNPAQESVGYGVSPLAAASLAIKTDLAMAQWNWDNFGRDKGVPAGILNIKESITDTDRDRVKEEWKENYGSGKRATAVLTGTEVEYQPIGLTHVDADYISGRQFNKEEIFLVLGIPPGMLDKNSTEANSQAGMEVFTRDTLWPQLVSICETLTTFLAPMFDPTLVVEPKDIRMVDKAAERAEAVALQPYLTINEMRAKYGYDSVPWGETPASGAGAVEITGQPVGHANAQIKPGEGAINPADQQLRNQLASADKTKALPSGIIWRDSAVILGPSAMREIQKFADLVIEGKDWKSFKFNASPVSTIIAAKAWAVDKPEDLVIGFEGTRTAHVHKAKPDGRPVKVDPNAAIKQQASTKLETQVGGVIKQMRDYYINKAKEAVSSGDLVHRSSTKGDPSDDGMVNIWSGNNNMNQFSSSLQRTLAANEIEIGSAIANAYIAQLSLNYGTDTIDSAVFEKAATDWAEKSAPNVTQDIITATVNAVMSVIKAWQEQDDATFQDLIDAFSQSYIFSPDRSKAIAITETTRASTFGSGQAANEVAANESVPLAYTLPQFKEFSAPCHPFCGCVVEPEPQVDVSGKITSIDARWYTSGENGVCEICFPRENLLMSEIIKNDFESLGDWSV